jgi:anthranilate synthase component 2
MNAMPRIVVLDNYDSFTYNLVHLLEQLVDEVHVVRNDSFELEDLKGFSHILISPGPGVPEEAGLTMEVIEHYAGDKPILGVCLGMQALLCAAGGQMENMDCVQHGSLDQLTRQGSAKLFAGLPQHFPIGRYHSWAFRPEHIPADYRVTGLSSDGYVMSVEHRHLHVDGVQFHPESIMTHYGLEMMRNWLRS